MFFIALIYSTLFSILLNMDAICILIIGFGRIFTFYHLFTSIMIFSDAKKINAGNAPPRRKHSRVVAWSPQLWGILAFIIPIIIFALYLYKREEIYKVNMPV
ncbi:MAG: hypothetical protein JSW00_04400 [Thermoplasmata archaeon]|nr:MAG: hypothetical protein JSW00_04400 [Thermoplasmata archaeon]